jgi:hypothetical protein
MIRVGKRHLFFVLAGVLVASGAWAAIDLWRPVSSSLRQFDADEVARLETDMWRSYYSKERLKLFNQLAELLRRQYRLPFLRSYLVAYQGAKAAFVFKDGSSRSDYERALPNLLKYYAAIRKVSDMPFDVNRAAQLELEWWIVHREREKRPLGDLDRTLAELPAEVYGIPVNRFTEHARYRAEAMLLRDRLEEQQGVTEADWQRIHEMLQQSWRSLWHAVSD